ncbi:MAG: PAS domain S-box protein [Leptolyngbya sp. SIO4C1]|nr:PAS domain S-box protein [Leptolyngbya sp. SIO4C1]
MAHAVENERFFLLSVDMLCVAGLDGYFKRVNPAFVKTLGHDAEALLAEQFLRFVHPSDWAATRSEMRQLATGTETIAFENRYRCRDGTYRWLLWTAYPDLTQQLIYASARDITARKQIEQRLQQQAALLDITTDAILVRDLDNCITYWNRGAAHLYGWQASEAMGQSANQLLYRSQNEFAEFDRIQQSLDREGHWQGELTQSTKTGQAVTVESRWSAVLDEAGHRKSTLVVNTDITQKKRLEAQFLQAQRLESLGTLASGMAHDLSNILTPILASSKLLWSGLPASYQQARRLARVIEANAQRGLDLIQKVLLFTHGAESSHIALSLEPILLELAQMIRETFPKTVKLQVHTVAGLGQVYGNSTEIYQILLNLCVNARDAMPAGGELTIAAQNSTVERPTLLNARPGDYVLVTVSDTGSGIPPEIRPRIFEPFFTTKAAGDGTGLGLSIALGMLKSCGGFIDMRSEAGRGTQFKVYLPAV